MRRRLGECLWTSTPTWTRGGWSEGGSTEKVKSDSVSYQGGQGTRRSVVAWASFGSQPCTETSVWRMRTRNGTKASKLTAFCTGWLGLYQAECGGLGVFQEASVQGFADQYQNHQKS